MEILSDLELRDDVYWGGSSRRSSSFVVVPAPSDRRCDHLLHYLTGNSFLHIGRFMDSFELDDLVNHLSIFPYSASILLEED